jgi:hypothetical protein
VVIGALAIAFVGINGWAFPLTDWKLLLAFLAMVSLSIIYFLRTAHDKLDRVWVPSAVVILLVNFVLNTHFYPQIAQYQGGSAMADTLKKEKVDLKQVYLYHTVIRSFDFYTASWRPMLHNEQIKTLQANGEPVLIFTNEDGLKKLKEAFSFSIVYKKPDFHITGLNGQFLNPQTRPSSYGYVYLVKL